MKTKATYTEFVCNCKMLIKCDNRFEIRSWIDCWSKIYTRKLKLAPPLPVAHWPISDAQFVQMKMIGLALSPQSAAGQINWAREQSDKRT